MKRVMIVDDEPDIILVVRKMLEREGYEVMEVESGEECLAKVKVERPELILLDVLMPGMDGWEVSKRIKEDEETRDMHVVMYTIISEEEGRKKSYEFAHADFHLDKPASMEKILHTVERYVE